LRCPENREPTSDFRVNNANAASASFEYDCGMWAVARVPQVPLDFGCHTNAWDATPAAGLKCSRRP
jgi:hypothetical protein